jgi:hypothetical protein
VEEEARPWKGISVSQRQARYYSKFCEYPSIFPWIFALFSATDESVFLNSGEHYASSAASLLKRSEQLGRIWMRLLAGKLVYW